MSDVSLASVREMIDTAFGDIDGNSVDFKLLQTVLYVLASRLKILKRRVLVEPYQPFESPNTTLWVNEVKVHAKVPKKKKKTAKDRDAAEDDDLANAGRWRLKKTVKERNVHKKIERPFKKGDTQAYRASVTRQTYFGSRSKKPEELTSKHSAKAAIEKSSSITPDKNTISKIPSKKQPHKTSEHMSAKSGRKSSAERIAVKHGSKDTGKYSEQQIQVDGSSDVPSTDTSVSIPSAKNRTAVVPYISSGSSVTASTESKGKVIVNVDLPDTEEYFKSSALLAQLLEPAEDIHHENLIIVHRVSVDKKKGTDSDSEYEDFKRMQPSSVVTAKQFHNLVQSVIELQHLYGNIDIPGITDNPVFMKILRKTTTYNEGVAGIQLSSRLEILEMSLEKLLALLSILCNQMRRREDADLISLQKSDSSYEDSLLSQALSASPASNETSKRRASIRHRAASATSETSRKQTLTQKTAPSFTAKGQPAPMIKPFEDTSQWINHEDLEVATQEVYEEYVKKIANTALQFRTSTDNTMKYLRNIDGEITIVLDHLDTRMTEVDKIVTDYAEKVNKIDAELSTQMTDYQDEMTQMQQDLENALDCMAEAIANQTSDEEAIGEMNAKFTNYLGDIDHKKAEQKQLNDIQDTCSLDIQGLVKEITGLKETKCDRDKVAEALSGKIDIRSMNNLVYLHQFSAVQGDFEKRIVGTYDKINNAEFLWQKAINELSNEFKNRAEISQVEALRSDVNFNLQKLRSKLQVMIDILGEVKERIMPKNIFHKEPCLSCDHPGQEEPTLKPIIPARPFIRPAEFTQIGDLGFCYPGMPIPHPKEQRFHAAKCTKYCGGPTNSDPDREFFHHRVIRDPATGAEANIPTMYIKQKPCTPCHFVSDRNLKRMTVIDEQEQAEEEELEEAVATCSW